MGASRLRSGPTSCYPAPVDVAELVFRRRGEDLLHVRLDRAETCIGSHATNDVVVPDSGIPDVAAVLVDRGAHRYRLRDLTGGLLTLNERAIDADEVDITDGDTLGFGSYALMFRVRSDGELSYGHTKLRDPDGDRSEHPAAVAYESRRIPVAAGRPFNIGTNEDNDLLLDDEFVSSFHCRITCQDGRWTLVDLASTNGTLVNGLRVGEAELPSPATIQIGGALVSFEVDSPSAGAPPQLPDGTDFFAGMLGRSANMRRVFDLIRRVADTDLPVLITGSSGCGKELVARGLHDEARRKAGPYLAINCGALASTIIEAELFGHVKGAFTGAVEDKKGAFEATQNGTLFLDEVGELPLELQPKLLRVLESSTVRPVGGTSEIPVNTRIVAATHRNLRELVDDGAFREDLFHRLFVLTIPIPGLAERPEDILPLARHFVQAQAGGRQVQITKRAQNALLGYGWPGNVRELRNVLLRALLLTDGDEIDATDLEFSADAFGASTAPAAARVRKVDEEERARILGVLEDTSGNRAEAARLLGLSKSTFHDRLRRLAIPAKYGRR